MHYKTQQKQIKDYLLQHGCEVVKTFKKNTTNQNVTIEYVVFKHIETNDKYYIELKDIIRCLKGNKKISKILVYCGIYEDKKVYCKHEDY